MQLLTKWDRNKPVLFLSLEQLVVLYYKTVRLVALNFSHYNWFGVFPHYLSCYQNLKPIIQLIGKIMIFNVCFFKSWFFFHFLGAPFVSLSLGRSDFSFSVVCWGLSLVSRWHFCMFFIRCNRRGELCNFCK